MSNETIPPAETCRAMVERSIEINASPEAIFEAILEDIRIFPDGSGKPMQFKLETYPGGRWYRDLGNDAGHFWGHVQVIKPPTLLELYGPMMISSATINHLSYRITSEGGKQRLTIKHRLFGDFDPKLPGMVGVGWQQVVERVKASALKKVNALGRGATS